ncbi:MAG: CoA transferase [Gammaproteobacteria bacterium]|nr:CoA transferase [Gammaproteobacteria bacterium]
MAGPLHGFRVLDLSAVVSGPLTGALLADQGADVIKVERTGAGDIQRHVGSKRNGFSGFFHVLNRGKRSLAVDLGSTEGVDIVRRLARDADVVIQNFRPGVVDRLGIGYSVLSADNPGLVYLSISGFGQTGPRARERAYDPIIQCYSGMADVQGRIHPEHPDRPEQVNMLLLDKLTAATGCQAVTAALLARSKSGQGQHIELSMLDTAIAFAWSDVAADLILQGDGVEQRPPVGASGTVFEFRDGWGATMTLSQGEFEGMCRVFGAEDIAADPRFASLEARMGHRDELREVLADRLAQAAAGLGIEEAGARLAAEQVPFARVRRLAELHDDAQVQHNEMFRDIDHPVAGRLREARPAPRFSATPAQAGAPAPTVGQHTREILEECGFGDQLEDYLRRGIVS